MNDQIKVHYLRNPDVVVITMGINTVQLDRAEAEALFVDLGFALKDMDITDDDV